LTLNDMSVVRLYWGETQARLADEKFQTATGAVVDCTTDRELARKPKVSQPEQRQLYRGRRLAEVHRQAIARLLEALTQRQQAALAEAGL